MNNILPVFQKRYCIKLAHFLCNVEFQSLLSILVNVITGAGNVEAPVSPARDDDENLNWLDVYHGAARDEYPWRKGRMYRSENERHGKQNILQEDVASRNPRKQKNGDTPLGCSGRTTLRSEQCGVPPKRRIIWVRVHVHC
jgi:hypothetical protein